MRAPRGGGPEWAVILLRPMQGQGHRLLKPDHPESRRGQAPCHVS